jgi:SAM-dependent methyltransferase
MATRLIDKRINCFGGKNVSTFWNKFYRHKNRFGDEPNPFAVTALKLIKTNRTVLDLGGGEGKDSVYFAQQGCRVVCLDFSKDALKTCREKSSANKVKVQTKLHDIQKPLPFKSGTFDAVYAHLSVQYFNDATTVRIFHEVHRILKPSGLLFVKVKSTNDPLYGQGKKVGKDMFKLRYTRHFFSRVYLLKMTEGFTPLSLKQSEEKSGYEVKGHGETSLFWEYIGQKIEGKT